MFSFSPVLFSLEDMLLEAVVVLATLVDPASENLSQVSVAKEAPAHRYPFWMSDTVGHLLYADYADAQGPPNQKSLSE